MIANGSTPTQSFSPRIDFGFIAPYAQLVTLLVLVSRPLSLALFLGSILTGLLPVAFVVVSGSLVGTIPSVVHDGLHSPSATRAWENLLVAGLVFAAMRLLDPMRASIGEVLGERVDRVLRERVMEAVASTADLSVVEAPQTRDILLRLDGTATGGFTIGGAVGPLANETTRWVRSLGCAVLIASFAWWLALLLAGARGIAFRVMRRDFLQATRAARNQTATLRRATYLRDLTLLPGPAKEVRLWGIAEWLVGSVEAEFLRAIRPVWRARWESVGPVVAAVVGVEVVTLLGYATVGEAAVRGQVDLGTLALLIGAIGGTGAIFEFGADTFRLADGISNMPSLRWLEKMGGSGHRNGSLPSFPPDAPRDSIRFDGVSFRYPGQARDTLANLDLTIPAGRSLAIVGLNGAGKTTLVKLLCGLYVPSSGRVLVDGQDLRELDRRAWQRRVGGLFQDYVHFALSARDNVALGAPEQAADLVLLREVARQAGALDLIEGLPNGWDTILSPTYREGVDLSGGQWQRIALARALFAIKGGARVLVLDEPTANLDVRAEAEFFDRFLGATAGLTTILISHRFSTVRRADRICVLDEGRIVEQGTHEELLAAAGRYAHLFQLQAARFADGGEGVG